jgi:hypothetical protein
MLALDQFVLWVNAGVRLQNRQRTLDAIKALTS